MIGDRPDSIEAYAWLQLADDRGEEVDQIIEQVVARLTIEEFAEASRRYQTLARDY